jgi:DNA polymerase-3 subunit alpha
VVDVAGPLALTVPEHRATQRTVTELAEMLERHRGDTEVTLRLYRGGVAKVFEVPMPVRVSADLYGELKGLLGPQCLG